MPFLIGPLLVSFTCAVNIVIDPTTTGKYQHGIPLSDLIRLLLSNAGV